MTKFSWRCAAWGLTAVVASALVISPRLAEASPRRIIERPDWVQKPTGDDVERFYPPKARAESVSGRVHLVCEVKIDGTLRDCSTTMESPANYGFAEAGLALAPLFRMTPKRIDGQPVEGGTVTIPLVFQVPSEDAEFGDFALVLTRVGTSPPRIAAPVPNADPSEPILIPCPDGPGQCEGHEFMWAKRPTAKQAAKIIAQVKPASGTSYATCTITSEGLLDGCDYMVDLTPRTIAAMDEALRLLRAPYKTADGLDTSLATVIVAFPWDELTGAASAPAETGP